MRTPMPAMSLATVRRARLGIGRIAGGASALVLFAWLFAPNLLAFLGSAVVAVPDRRVALWAHVAASAPFIEAMRWVSAVQGTAGMLVMTAVAAALLWRAGQRRAVPMLLLSVPGGMLLNVAVKHAVQRARPEWGDALQMPASFSFPSGHVAGATLFYGLAVVWFWPRLRAGWARAALSMAAVSMVLLVALSRIVLGVHYASDCLGAVIEGLLWLAICAPWAHAAGAAVEARREAP